MYIFEFSPLLIVQYFLFNTYNNNTKLHTIKENHRQEKDDEEAAATATAATGEGKDCVGINDMKLM